MRIENQSMWLRIAVGLSVVGGLSACSSVPVPQNYETTSSRAAVTSTLAGSAIVSPFSVAVTVAHIVGTVNHQTGALRLDSGTYLFVDANGPTDTGRIEDGHGARVYTDFARPGPPPLFDYVSTYRLNASGESQVGVMGIVTAAADMPGGGSATYSAAGTALFQTVNLSGVSSAAETYLAGAPARLLSILPPETRSWT